MLSESLCVAIFCNISWFKLITGLTVTRFQNKEAIYLQDDMYHRYRTMHVRAYDVG